MKHDPSSSDELEMSEEEEVMELDSEDNNNMEEEEHTPIVKQEQKKHKKSYDPRFSVPTYEEKQMMRNADMNIELSLLEMEAQQYVESLDVKHICDDRISEYLKTVNTFLKKLPEMDITPKSVNVPSLFQRSIGSSGEGKELKLRFCKPAAVYVIGSYIQKTTTSFPMVIDMTLQLSNTCIAERDLINWKYFNKRALYLSQLAKEFKKEFTDAKLSYQWLHGDFDKPCLLLSIPSKDVFPLTKLIPSRNNVHIATDSDTPSTWYYNCSILEDALTNHYSTFILNYLKQYPNLVPSLKLIRNWIKASCFDKHFTSFTAAIILCILVQKQRVTSLLSPWQTFIVFLDYLASSSILDEGLHFKSDSNSVEFDEEDYEDCVRLIDDAYGYNLTYRLDSYNYQEIIERAKQDSLRIRGLFSSALLPSLLTQSKSLYSEYDLVIRLKLTDLEKDIIYGKRNVELNYSLYVQCVKDVEFWCRKALQTRANVVRTEFVDGSSWEVNEKYTKPTYILLCIQLNQANISKFADKGPAAKTDEVKDWLYLWGNKSELRRYQDGSILYTNLWSCKTGENHLIPAEIVRYVLSLHTMAVIELKNLSQSLQPFVIASPNLSCGEKITEVCQKIMEIVNTNNKNTGIDFSAQISSIEPVSSVLYNSELNPAVYSNPYLSTKSNVGTHSVTTVVRPIDFVITMQGVVGLPDDLEVMQKMKSIWYTSMASLLEKNHFECLVNRDYLDVVCEGSVLRFRCCTTREVQMYSRLVKNGKNLQERLFYGFMTNHTFTVKNMSLQNPSFIPCLRLTKLWISANYLSSSIPTFIVELLLLSVYEKYSPLNPIRGFLLFLDLLKSFDWSHDILMINTNHSLTEEKMKEIQKNLEEKKKEGKATQFIHLVTPYDVDSFSTYALTEPAVWNRLCRIALKSLDRISKFYLQMDQKGLSGLFNASTKEFDVVITIKDEYLTPTTLTKIMGEKQDNRGIVYTTKEPRNVMLNRSRLLIGYNPEECIYDAIRKEVGSAGVVLMNKEYGNQLFISWKPSFFLPLKMSMAGVTDCCPIWKDNETKDDQKDSMLLVRDVFDLMNRIKRQLGELVQSVQL